jgi:hypothetical protein
VVLVTLFIVDGSWKMVGDGRVDNGWGWIKLEILIIYDILIIGMILK